MGWFGRFYGTAIGKKLVVAVTGAIMVLFLVSHMLANLFAWEGPEKLNGYGELLRLEPALLWGARTVLLTAVILHIVTTVQLVVANRRARSRGYAVKKSQAATWASRTMAVGGLLLAGFILYHILHFTTGTVHHAIYEQFGHGNVYARVVESFRNPFITGAYVLAMFVLCFHLWHGVKSLGETLGVSHPRYVGWFRRGGPLLAAVLFLGFISVPLGVVFGLIGHHP